MFEINMSGRGLNMGALRQRKWIPLAVGAGISALGSILGGKMNANAQKNAAKNAYRASEYQPGTTMGDFGEYNPNAYDLSGIQGILSGQYEVDPELRQQMISMASEMKQRGETDYAIQKSLHQFWQQRQKEAAGYEQGLAGYAGEALGIDAKTGKPREGGFDPRSQTSIAGFKYLAPELAGAQQDAEAERKRIQASDLDPIAKERMLAQINDNYYRNVTAAREGQRDKGLQVLSGLHSTARNTSAAPMVGWNSQAGNLLQGVGGLDQGAMGLGLQQNLGLAGYMDSGQRFNEANKQWGIGRNDANRQFLEGNRFNAWATREGINSGAYQNAMAGAGRPGDAVGSLAGTIGSMVANKPKAPGGSFISAVGGKPKGR